MSRIVLVSFVLVSAFAGIVAMFWQQEVKYLFPTTMPSDYKAVATGSKIDTSLLPKGSAYFLHFYNPDCPCSRFNARHVKSLIRAYGDSVRMFVVVPSARDLAKAKEEFEELEMIIDEGGAIAEACGVYSTPQAVIIDQNSLLYYRGNYNKSRYCTARASNFAELSLIALLNRQPSPSFGILASQSYGCEWGEEKNELELF
jgi:hypothetical protein